MKVSVTQAAEILLQGHPVGVPTETVYGLAAPLLHEEAIRKIFALKKRPQDNPLIVHVADIEQIRNLTTDFPEKFELLAKTFWPGPLTLVIPCIPEKIPTTVRAGLSTVAFRIPNHPEVLKLLALTGPLVMPSANLSGKPSSTKAEHVEHDFGENFPVIDGGNSNFGLESTILIFLDNKWHMGRLGTIPAENFQEYLGYTPMVVAKQSGAGPLCPGQNYRHYAPLATMYLEKNIPENCCNILGFKERNYPKTMRVFLLGSLDEPESVAAGLYNLLRTLDSEGINDVGVDMDFPDVGLWKSIRERLKKAADQK